MQAATLQICLLPPSLRHFDPVKSATQTSFLRPQPGLVPSGLGAADNVQGLPFLEKQWRFVLAALGPHGAHQKVMCAGSIWTWPKKMIHSSEQNRFN